MKVGKWNLGTREPHATRSLVKKRRNAGEHCHTHLTLSHISNLSSFLLFRRRIGGWLPPQLQTARAASAGHPSRTVHWALRRTLPAGTEGSSLRCVGAAAARLMHTVYLSAGSIIQPR